jgi:Zn-dependent metalloprotease
MNKLLTLLFAVIFSVSAAGQVFYGKNAAAVVNNATTVRINPATKTPDYIRFETGKELTEGQLREFLNKNYRLTNDFTWHKLNEITDDAGDIHIRYRLAYKGFPIHDAMFILHFRNGKIYAVNGNIPKNFKPANAVILSEPAALKAALNHINAKTYKWQIKEEEDFIKKTNDDPNATWFPKGRIQLKKDNETGSYNYVWVFDIYAHNPLSRADYYVSASDGSIVFVNNKIQHGDSLGTAVTKFSGSQPITADYHNNLFRLRESGRGNGIETYDMNNGQSYGSAVDFIDSNNYWNNVNLQKDEVAGDAHWGMEMTYDYYYNKHNRNSIDGNGFKLKGYVHYKTNYVTAFWDGQRMTFGDGNSTYQPLVALDIVGHEISHGLTQFTADLDYSYESGALNEAYSDIFGTSIEFYAKPATANWLIGEDIGSAMRSMSNPKSKGDPDTYMGQNYYLGSGDNGGVHTNSSVLNHWYYLLAAGGQGVNDNNDTFNIQGVGVDTAGKIAFRTLTVYLTNTSNFADCRFYSIQAAMDLYGPCSLPVQSTTSAFYAVGIGPDYIPGVNADFSAGITQYCTPSPVSFTNLSNNANSFHWDFGDGNTSTVANPTHNYTSYGNFTVKLIASGGSCGSDTTVKTAYISIDTTNPCLTLMPSSGSVVKTHCQGILMDDGGTANYSNNTNSTITIAPAGASKITLTFTDFHFEKDYDYLKIYDGPNAQSPLIGSYDGDNLPNGGTIISSGGALTVVEETDQMVNKAVSSTTVNAPPDDIMVPPFGRLSPS